MQRRETFVLKLVVSGEAETPPRFTLRSVASGEETVFDSPESLAHFLSLREPPGAEPPDAEPASPEPTEPTKS